MCASLYAFSCIQLQVFIKVTQSWEKVLPCRTISHRLRVDASYRCVTVYIIGFVKVEDATAVCKHEVEHSSSLWMVD